MPPVAAPTPSRSRSQSRGGMARLRGRARWLCALGGLAAATALPTGDEAQAAILEATRMAPVADAYVNAAKPGVNFGRSRRLELRSSPAQRAFVRFGASLDGPVVKATLRLVRVRNSKPRIRVKAVTGRRWTEHGVTFANAPKAGGGGIPAEASGANAVSVDVTS